MVTYFIETFHLDPAPIFNNLCNVIIVVSTHMPVAINCAADSTLDTILYNASIMETNLRNIYRFKTMAIRPTKNNLVGIKIGPFLYLRIIWKLFSLPDSGKGCVTQREKNLKNK